MRPRRHWTNTDVGPAMDRLPATACWRDDSPNAALAYIQLYHRDWDHHSQLIEEFPLRAKEVDRASAALIRDLHVEDC